jgi:ubiquinone/menaquinone biosynthesis C-methylase UbiE
MMNGASNYYADVEDPGEFARLLLQERLMTKALGPLLPEDCDSRKITHVLDVACGPGGWAIDVALAYRHMHVVGIDISSTVVAAAQEYAQGDGVSSRVSFRIMDAREPLAFPDNTFDFVNARFMQSCLLREQWPAFIQECARVMRPGGIVRLTEFEVGTTNSLAVGQALFLFGKALYAAGLGFSPSGIGVGITPMLTKFLSDAGIMALRSQAFALDAGSHGSEAAKGWVELLMVFFSTLSPFIVRQKLATQEELDRLASQALAEMNSEEFRSLLYLLSVWGSVPA